MDEGRGDEGAIVEGVVDGVEGGDGDVWVESVVVDDGDERGQVDDDVLRGRQRSDCGGGGGGGREEVARRMGKGGSLGRRGKGGCGCGCVYVCYCRSGNSAGCFSVPLFPLI